MHDIELKPCPLCGREAHIASGLGSDPDGHWCEIRCNICCLGLLVEGRPSKKYAEKDASARWNRRKFGGAR
jgi:hypothetical protein